MATPNCRVERSLANIGTCSARAANKSAHASPGERLRGAAVSGRRMAPIPSALASVAAVVARGAGALVVLALVATAPASESPGAAHPPSTLHVAHELERILVLPKGALSLFEYTRYYAMVLHDGRSMVRGEFVGGPSKMIVVKSEASLPLFMDGGCSVVNVLYDVMAHKVVQVFCNGYA
jgi:hypothetical protein